MGFLEMFGAFMLLYNLLYLLIPLFLDSDMLLALKEKFGKPAGMYHNIQTINIKLNVSIKR